MAATNAPSDACLTADEAADSPQAVGRGPLSPNTKSALVPEIKFETIAPTLQQTEGMAAGLRILATWLLRHHERLQKDGEKRHDGS